MEKYINKNTLVEDDFYKLFQSSVICSICENIYINPVMCLKCQKVFCKRCVEKINENDGINQHNCEEPDYKKSLDKNEILSKLKFFCVGCEAQIVYSEAERHHESCCPGKTSNGMNFKNKIKIKKLTLKEIEKLRKQGKEVAYISGKQKLLLLIY